MAAKTFFSKKAIYLFPLVAFIFYQTFQISKHALHVTMIHELAPKYLSWERLNWLLDYPVYYHMMAIFPLLLTPVILMLGIWNRGLRTKYQKIFKACGLTNGLGDTPKYLTSDRFDRERISYTFDANGVGIGGFETKKEQIESAFKSTIESIKHGSHQGLIVLTFSNHVFPEKVSYLDLVSQCSLPEDSFFISSTAEEVLTQKVSDLPHMLIAGTTGSGKSIFFKQVLMGLLESSSHTQM